MDDQPDYAEEAANRALLHEECEGCETCQPHPEWDKPVDVDKWANRENWGFGHEPW